MSRLRGSLNRAALACVGVSLTAAGVMLGATDVLDRAQLPDWWPMFLSGWVRVDHGTLPHWLDRDWWPPLVVIALGATLLLCLGWCALQFRSGRVHVLPLDRDDVTVSGSALADAVERRTRSLPEVVQARVYLLGRPKRLRLRLHVVLAPGASPAAVLSHFGTHTLPEVRKVTNRRIDAEVCLRTRRHRPGRVH